MVSWLVCFMVSNTTFNNISVISWQSVLLMEETLTIYFVLLMEETLTIYFVLLMEETLTICFVLLMEETLTIYFVLLVTLFNKQKLFRCLIVVVIRYIHTPPT